MCNMCVPGIPGVQKKASDLLELELEVFVSQIA